MSDTHHEALIGRLTTNLLPVRRLASPGRRALLWITLVAAAAVVLAQFANLPAMRARLFGAPDMWLSVVGAIATMICAAVAAFQTSIPGRSARWVLLPLPGLVLWIGASGIGCLRTLVVPATHGLTMQEERGCMGFIVGVSLPLCIILILMLRRACPLRPGLTAAMVGLAASAASATLLMFFHPLDASATDLAGHAFAVGIVVLLNRIVGGRLLTTGLYRSR